MYDELEDTEGLIGICKSEGKKDKRTNNDPQNIKPKTMNSCAPEGKAVAPVVLL